MVDMDVIMEEASKVSSGSQSFDDSGRSALFRRLNDAWAIKLYRSESLRDLAYNNQQLAAEHDLGPQVGGIFDLPTTTETELIPAKLGRSVRTSDYRFGYVTEIVEAYTDDEPNIDPKEHQDLLNELHDIGFDFHDDIGQNMGRSKDGKLICIDFAE